MEKDGLVESFGVVLQKVRTQVGMSQEELSNRSGLHRTYISDIERGMRNVSLRNIEKLAKALGVPAWQLIRIAEEGANVSAQTGVRAATGNHGLPLSTT